MFQPLPWHEDMKRKLNIEFIGFGDAYPLEKRLVYQLIDRHYEICRGVRPDYVVFQSVSFADTCRYDGAVKISLVGENCVPDFNLFDYAFGFDHLSFGDRYLRCPLFALYRSFKDLAGRTDGFSDEELLDRKFCSFVVSNTAYGDPMRRKFFERLSKYKKVDSGGRWMNNVGGPVKDKLEFCRNYKFNIAFENSASPGYTTEKIMEAYVAQTVPIYYGNPTVETDFRLESMVRVKGEDDIEWAVEEVIRLDNDDTAYLAKCRERCFAVPDPMVYERELEAFLVHIFEQPIERARRRAQYGHQAMMREHLCKLMAVDRLVGKARQILHV